ncbi:MAG: hypothetical protein QXN23_03600 [Candidatus Caldarchaeum sp.]|uniref:Uncharacterized protein n=1 Tax=Caldiarchaeum subterraneum TaxID=311458 RepID=A0A7C4E1N8_CALS0|nr:hypothetical protein [Candidatus Caldarchaeales archaeon]MDJ0272179.1 hypothetical protein [Candidatus Caldarchaeales archaeon]
MRKLLIAAAAALLIPAIIHTTTSLKLLILIASATVFIIATSLTPIHYRKAGWTETRATYLTLGIQTAVSFISTAINTANILDTFQTILLFAANTYLLIRVIAESLAVNKTSNAAATASTLLGLSSYITYIISTLEALRT